MSSPLLSQAAFVAVFAAIQATKVAVVYSTSGGDLTFNAGLGSYRSEAEPLENQYARIDLSEFRDLIAWPADLNVDPVQGDAVQITLPNGDLVNFEVVAIPPEACWRWTDRFRTALRVHLREI